MAPPQFGDFSKPITGTQTANPPWYLKPLLSLLLWAAIMSLVLSLVSGLIRGREFD